MVPINIGTRCDAPGSTLRTLDIRVGYYRAAATSIDVRICPDASANCGDRSVCPNSTSGCAGGSDPEQPCHAGLGGHFCVLCINASDGIQKYYVQASDTENARCAQCPKSALVLVLSLTAALAATLILLRLASRSVWRHLSDARRAALRIWWKWWNVLDLGTKLKLLIGFYQIATKIGHVYRVPMPAEVRALLNAFQFSISLGLDLTGPFECVGVHRYDQRLVVWLFLPLALVGGLFAIGWLRRRLATSASQHWALANVCRLMFLLYPIVTTRAFEAFPCHDFGAEGRWLMADVSVQCGTHPHTHIRVCAWLAIGLYPIGWTITTALLLFTARESIQGRSKPTVLSRTLRFVYGEYRPEYFWWELCEMFRRFLLVGLLSVVDPGSILQLVVATTACVLYLVVQLLASPLVVATDNFIGLCGSAALVLMFFSCIILKLKVLTETEEVSEVLSPRLRQLFDVPLISLTCAMLISVLSSLVLAVLILIAQVRGESARVVREARAAQARRLRYRKDHKEVLLPPLDLAFHLFLSHTWAQGEEAMRTVKLRLLEMLPDVKVFLDKDDLKTGAGAEYVDVSRTVLCFCTEKYFKSRACAREIFRAVLKGKPLIALLEPDKERGSLEQSAILTLIKDERYPPDNGLWVQQWRLDGEVFAWGFEATPTCEEVAQALFASEPIEWNRFSAFMDVTMFLIAVRCILLSDDFLDTTYVQGEVGNQPLVAPALTHGRIYHLYVSPHNIGAQSVATELGNLLSSAGQPASLKSTQSLSELEHCEHMLLYLTRATWTSGEASEALAGEVGEAQLQGVHLLLVHEFPSVMDATNERGACAFNDMWNDGWTPKHLLTGEANIYKQIANPLKPGRWRKAGLAMVALKLAEGGGEREQRHIDEPGRQLPADISEQSLRPHGRASNTVTRGSRFSLTRPMAGATRQGRAARSWGLLLRRMATLRRHESEVGECDERNIAIHPIVTSSQAELPMQVAERGDDERGNVALMEASQPHSHTRVMQVSERVESRRSSIISSGSGRWSHRYEELGSGRDEGL